MPKLEWKETHIETERGRVTITHWTKHDPHEIVNALLTEPIAVKGDDPKVYFHKFGSRQVLAVRGAPEKKKPYARQPPEIFATLQQMVAEQKALVEMPVALIHDSDSGTRIVTFLKKKKRTLTEYLLDKKTSLEDKRKACLSAVRRLAALHAGGYVHLHPHTENFLVGENGQATLIDPTRVDKAKNVMEWWRWRHNKSPQAQDLYEFTTKVLPVFSEGCDLIEPNKQSLLESEIYHPLTQELKEEYEKTLGKLRLERKIKKRRSRLK